MIAVAWVLFGLLLTASALLRAAGASLVRTHRADALHDAAEGDLGADVVADLLEDPRPLQAELGLPTAALALGAVAAGTWAVAVSLDGWWAAVGIVGVWLGAVVVGDVLARGFGRRRPRRLAYRLARLLALSVGIGAAASDLVTDDDVADPDPHDDPEVARHEEAERELISSVIEFGDTVVREVMIPRTDMVSLPVTATSDDALDLLVETGFSRVPVIGADVDDVVGIVFARDMLRLLDEGRHGMPLESFMRTPNFVPETQRVPDLLRFMQASRVHMVIVVDEFGGTAGIATIEDLLEELVGEIADEFDEDEEMVFAADDGSLLVDARFPIGDFAELLDMDLPDEDWDTVGGLVLSLSGRVPRIGERFEVEGVVLSPTRVQGRRIAQVRVTRP